MGSMGVIYRLLGELEVGRDGRLVGLPGGPTLIVLAALLLNANHRMSKAELIRVAWGDDDVAEAQLHKRVMAVRDLLAQIGRRADIVTHPRFGYELRAATGDIDAALFGRLVRDAEAAKAESRPEEEAGKLREALRLWRGPHPLSNVPGDAFRQETFALLAFPPFLALVGPGVNSLLWVPLVLMMVFPGVPLVLGGLWLRHHMEPQEVEDYWF